MSISSEGVKFENGKTKKGVTLILLVAILEAVFSFFLYLVIAGKIFAPEPTEAAPGVPQLMSYQGRLTDSSGNPLGGAGTTYCFRYSIYDSISGGNKIWPSGAPTNSTTTVTDGIFNDKLGRADAINFDLFGTSTLYLNVDVNTVTSTCGGSWESLSPRQQLTSSGFALASEDIYGNYISTVIATSTKIQIGASGGVTSGQILLSLSVKNVADTLGTSCTDNGSLWYNSANTRALICENGTIQPISNSSTTIAGIGANSGAPITAGNIVFSNSNNVSFGMNGSTITASAAAGGGGGFALQDYALLDRAYMIAVTNMTAISQRPIFVPFVLPGSLTWNRGDIEVSRASAGSNLFTADFGIYRYVNSTQLSLMGSLRNTYSGTATASQSGIRRILFAGMDTGATALTPGQYVMGMMFSASAGTASMNYSLRGATLGPPAGNVFPGANSYATATSQLSSMPLARFLGRYTATSGSLPDTVGFNQVQHWTSMYRIYFHLEST